MNIIYSIADACVPAFKETISIDKVVRFFGAGKHWHLNKKSRFKPIV